MSPDDGAQPEDSAFAPKPFFSDDAFGEIIWFLEAVGVTREHVDSWYPAEVEDVERCVGPVVGCRTEQERVALFGARAMLDAIGRGFRRGVLRTLPGAGSLARADETLHHLADRAENPTRRGTRLHRAVVTAVSTPTAAYYLEMTLALMTLGRRSPDATLRRLLNRSDLDVLAGAAREASDSLQFDLGEPPAIAPCNQPMEAARLAVVELGELYRGITTALEPEGLQPTAGTFAYYEGAALTGAFLLMAECFFGEAYKMDGRLRPPSVEFIQKAWASHGSTAMTNSA